MSKPQVYVRLGISDIVVTKEECDSLSKWIAVRNKEGKEVGCPELYLVGYELEDGTECNEDGEV